MAYGGSFSFWVEFQGEWEEGFSPDAEMADADH